MLWLHCPDLGESRKAGALLHLPPWPQTLSQLRVSAAASSGSSTPHWTVLPVDFPGQCPKEIGTHSHCSSSHGCCFSTSFKPRAGSAVGTDSWPSKWTNVWPITAEYTAT